MDYEKLYKKALERAKIWQNHLYETNNKDYADELNYIFPKLAESEDEEIRKQIRELLLDAPISELKRLGIDLEKAFAWLEKQGEQKSVNEADEDIVEVVKDTSILDMIEPKFKVGDWVTNGDYTWKIVDVKPLDYMLQSQDGNVVDDTISYVDKEFHSFTIEDAKPGDVLVDSCQGFNNPFIFILKKFETVDFGLTRPSDFSSYCCLTMSDKQKFKEGAYHHMHDGIKPATKEERDLLFSKMKEAGYEWDAEKKELKKIGQNPIDKVEPKFHEGDIVIKNTGFIGQILEVGDNEYTLTNTGFIPFKYEHLWSRWTIQDAKDGDVLATWAGAFIYNNNNGGGSCPGCYCGINTLGKFQTGVEHHWTGKKVYPATKEQRDLLFSKMKEAGYEWDAEKKELKKVDEELTDFEKSLKHIMIETLECGDTRNIKADADMLLRLAHNHAWSEEDEYNVCTIQNIICASSLIETTEEKCKLLDWLKSFKDRVQPQWEPTKEQMNALDSTLQYSQVSNNSYESLNSLYNDLKKLIIE